MPSFGILNEQIDKQAELASAALKNIAGINVPSMSAGTGARLLLPRAVLDILAPYLAVGFFAERVVQSDTFNVELVRALHSRLLPLEHMADEMLTAAKQKGYFDDPETAEPFQWLENCNEQVKDCIVALASMLDPQLDDLMQAAMGEHQRGETIPLDSLS